MFDRLLKSKFFSKCKSDIKLTRTRIEIITKKRNATQKYLRNDVADLLRNGMDSHAFDRAEGLLAEMNRSQCYQLIDEYCEHILKNLPAMNKQGECPEECREAAASLMFAAARFADLPELRELRTMFSERYGKSLDYYVSKQLTEKLKPDPPSKEAKLLLLHEIAAESGLDWDAKALENKLFNESPYAKNRVNGSAPKAGAGYEYGRARELKPAGKKESPVDARNGLSPPVRTNKAATPVGKVPKEVDEDEPLKRPPYTKPVPNKAASSSSDDSDSSDDKVEAAPEPTVDEVLRGNKPIVKSVRTKHTKPLPDQEVVPGGDEKEKVVNKENVAQGRRILRFFDGGRGQIDEEEKMMDRLLRHYSRKKGSNKPEGKLPQTDSRKEKNLKGQDGPTRASSLRVEPVGPVDTDPRKHSRAASFHPGNPGNAHVHPNMPDYDEFMARLEAFRRK
ncbi:uncharacterized protein LOC121801239 [Salvia splendens]|uniref:uncharacterized protein LOC121801239 n=1 Tax=Salvia splendens TaxID=180675 RepID=UPI0011031F45|nr:uncharacterized protein LOC121801239 [Salvia splendens]